MTPRKTVYGALAFAALTLGAAAHAATMTVYKSPNCGCCAKCVSIRTMPSSVYGPTMNDHWDHNFGVDSTTHLQ